MMEPQPNIAPPRTATIILASTLVWCIYFGCLMLFFFDWFYPLWNMIMLLLGLVSINVIGQTIIHMVVRKKNLKPWKRNILFAIPSLPIALVALYFSIFLLWVTLTPSIKPTPPETQRRYENVRRIKVVLSPELSQLGIRKDSDLMIGETEADSQIVRFSVSRISSNNSSCSFTLIARALTSDGREIGNSRTFFPASGMRFRFPRELNQDLVDRYEISIAQ